MEARNDKAIGNWLLDIESGALGLPRFQRLEVWKKQKVCQFLKTLIVDSETPVGVFLILPTDSSKPAFPPRTIGGSILQPGVCETLLLDGQQRLSALWRALHDTDEEFGYYVQFNNKFEVDDIKAVNKEAKAYQKLDQDPTRQYKKRWFPVRLLNPLSGERVVDDWLQLLELKKLKLNSLDPIENLIMDTRNIFSRKKQNGKRGGKIIPHFRLNRTINKSVAVNIYKTINTNFVKLSDHYLAVAEMEKNTGKSLYDIADRLIKKVPSIEDLETDEVGELILKISCLLQDKIPSGGSYKARDFDFDAVLKSEKRIFDGVKWAVEKLKELQIWHGSQLPSVVPLRVLPALHEHMPKMGQSLADANKVITKYLWYAFLTDRYDKQANERLKEDYDDLRGYFGKLKKVGEIRIFKEHASPSNIELEKAGWPQSTRRLARGILLVCCQGGAKTLASGEILTSSSYDNREKHHIFPKSKLAKMVGHSGDYALNCLLVPEIDNKKYNDELPGDYITKLFQDLGIPLPQLNVVNRLETHLLSEQAVERLVMATQDAIDNGQITLETAYDDFIKTRVHDVGKKIRELLR